MRVLLTEGCQMAVYAYKRLCCWRDCSVSKFNQEMFESADVGRDMQSVQVYTT